MSKPSANEQAFCDLFQVDCSERVSRAIRHAELIAKNPVVGFAAVLLNMSEPPEPETPTGESNVEPTKNLGDPLTK